MERQDLLDPDLNARLKLWDQLKQVSETYRAEVGTYPVRKFLSPDAAARLMEPFDFTTPLEASEVFAFASKGLLDHSFHFAHPQAFSRFNPATTTIGAIADGLAAVFNPQLASWRAAPFPIAIERHLINAFSDSRLGRLCSRSSASGTNGRCYENSADQE